MPQGYLRYVVDKLWSYRERRFAGRPDFFDSNVREGNRPPVFRREHGDLNRLYPPKGSSQLVELIRNAIPVSKRQRHFCSMKSSQALAQSVLGYLVHSGKLDLLNGLMTEDGETAFFSSAPLPNETCLEKDVTWLGEPSSTNVDLFCSGKTRVAVECKFTEADIGKCSRPNLIEGKNENFKRDYCDGTYTAQRNRKTRCSLTAVGVEYWRYIPQILKWSNGNDLAPCPLRSTFQLVRNVLAATVEQNGELTIKSAHALLIYDARNPAFQNGGYAWGQVRSALRDPSLLRRCTWQRLLQSLSKEPSVHWLTKAVQEKYGLESDHILDS